MNLEREIIEAMRGSGRPRPIAWVTPRTSTQHESRVGPLMRDMARRGILREEQIGGRPYPGYRLNE